MDILIELLNKIDVAVVFTTFKDNGEYNTDDVDFLHIKIDPNSEYDAELILKHEFIHALQHELHRDGVLPFPKHIWNNIKPPAIHVKRALSEYRVRYEDDPLDLVEIQAMALETMPVKVFVEIYTYIINL